MYRTYKCGYRCPHCVVAQPLGAILNLSPNIGSAGGTRLPHSTRQRHQHRRESPPHLRGHTGMRACSVRVLYICGTYDVHMLYMCGTGVGEVIFQEGETLPCPSWRDVPLIGIRYHTLPHTFHLHTSHAPGLPCDEDDGMGGSDLAADPTDPSVGGHPCAQVRDITQISAVHTLIMCPSPPLVRLSVWPGYARPSWPSSSQWSVWSHSLPSQCSGGWVRRAAFLRGRGGGQWSNGTDGPVASLNELVAFPPPTCK